MEGVVFPPKDSSLRYLIQERFGRSPQELARKVVETLKQPNPNTVEVIEMGKLLASFQHTITEHLQQELSPAEFDSLFALGETISHALSALAAFQSQPSQVSLLLTKAETTWRHLYEPAQLPPPEIPQDEVVVAYHAVEVPVAPSFRAMKGNLSLRFKDFVSATQSIQRKLDTVVIFEENACEMQEKMKRLKSDNEKLEETVGKLETEIANLREKGDFHVNSGGAETFLKERRELQTYIQSLESQLHLSKAQFHPYNEHTYRECALSGQGVLYQDSSLQLSCQLLRQADKVTVELKLTNQCLVPMTVETEVIQREGVTVEVESDWSAEIAGGRSAGTRLTARSSAPYREVPRLLLQVRNGDAPRQIVLKLPLPVSVFITSEEVAVTDLSVLMERYSRFVTKRTLPRAVQSRVSERLALAGSLCVRRFGSIQVGTGQGYGHQVLVKAGSSAEAVELVCLSPDPQLREALLSHLVTILQT